MVVRYDPDIKSIGSGEYVGTMEENSGGDYVEYADYEALYDMLCDTQCEIKWIKDKITDIYKDM